MTRRLRWLLGCLVACLALSGLVALAATPPRPEDECRRCGTSAHTVVGAVGCCITKDTPRWRCTQCGHTWGRWHDEPRWWEFWRRVRLGV